MDIRMLALVLLVNVVGSLADLRSPLFRPRRNGLREDITDQAGISRTRKRETTASPSVSTLHLYTLIPPPDPTASPAPNESPQDKPGPKARSNSSPKSMARRSTNEPNSSTESNNPKSKGATQSPEDDPSIDSRPRRPAPKPGGRSSTPRSPKPTTSRTDPEDEGAVTRRPAGAADSGRPKDESEPKARGGKPRAKARPADSEENPEPRGGKRTDSEEEPSTRRLSNLRERPKAKPRDSDEEMEEEEEEEEEKSRRPSNEPTTRKAKRPKGKPAGSSDQESEEAVDSRARGKPAIGSRFDEPDDEEEEEASKGKQRAEKSKSNRFPMDSLQNPQNFQFPPFFVPSFVPGFSSPYTNPYSPNAWAGSNGGSRGYGAGAGAASFASATASAGAPDLTSNYNAYPQGGYPGGYGDTSNMVNAPTPGVYNSGGYGSYGGDVYDPSSFAFPDYNFADFQKQMEENFRQLQAQFQKQQQSLFDATNRIAGDPSSIPGLHSAVSSINLGPEGGYQAGAINPVRPGVESRFGEEVPPPSGNTYGVFSSSSSHTMVGPDGKTISHKSSTTGVNDNGKITFRTIED